eukprot:scaffold28.g7538.t1
MASQKREALLAEAEGSGPSKKRWRRPRLHQAEGGPPGKRTHLGVFERPEEAALAWDAANLFRRLHFPGAPRAAFNLPRLRLAGDKHLVEELRWAAPTKDGLQAAASPDCSRSLAFHSLRAQTFLKQWRKEGMAAKLQTLQQLAEERREGESESAEDRGQRAAECNSESESESESESDPLWQTGSANEQGGSERHPVLMQGDWHAGAPHAGGLDAMAAAAAEQQELESAALCAGGIAQPSAAPPLFAPYSAFQRLPPLGAFERGDGRLAAAPMLDALAPLLGGAERRAALAFQLAFLERMDDAGRASWYGLLATAQEQGALDAAVELVELRGER